MPFCNLTGDISPLQLQITDRLTNLNFLVFHKLSFLSTNHQKNDFQTKFLWLLELLQSKRHSTPWGQKLKPEKDAYQKQ